MNDRIFAGALAAQRAGNLAEAARLCREILKTDPRAFNALYLLGFILSQAGQIDEAERLIGEAIRVNPRSADAHYNRGCLLQRLRRPQEALVCFERAVALKPDYADALLNRGHALLILRRYAEALADFDRVLSMTPDLVPALLGRGSALSELRHDADALATFDRVLAREPENPLAAVGRGNVLFRLRRYESAAAEFDRALARWPDLPEALINRAAALFELKRVDEAVRDYGKALALAPDLPYAHGNFIYYKLHACDWRGLHEDRDALAAELRQNKAVVLPFVNLSLSSSPEEQLRCARLWTSANHPPTQMLWRGENYRHERMRVVYLSADFHAHATAHLMAGVFENHDRIRFETVAVSYGPDDESEMRARLKSSFDRFIDVRTKSDFEIAAQLRELEADAIIDLKGLTKDSRSGILSFRPAPIQAHYLGYPGTMGAPYVDYIIADKIVIPEEHRRFYSEQVVYMPDTYQANAPAHMMMMPPKTRRDYGLPESGFIFCCFNNNFKILPEIFGIWMRLLARVDGSVLWLMADNPIAARNLVCAAKEHGVAADRLVFASRAGLAEHLARHALADLFLDTLPYGAHTTASDALRAGLPVVTCMGDAFAGRVAASLLQAIGAPELICGSLEDYEALALKLAHDPAALYAIKEKLARNRDTHPLFDTQRFTRNLEAALTIMLDIHRRGEPPTSFAVDPAIA